MAPSSFLDLFPELRLMIYHSLFEDSVIEVCQSENPAIKSSRVNILYTCKVCYEEARSIYWEDSRVETCQLHPFCDDNAHEISRSLSDFAITHIKHIGDIFPRESYPTGMEVIERFPRLETYEAPTVYEPVEVPLEYQTDGMSICNHVMNYIFHANDLDTRPRNDPHDYIRNMFYPLDPETSKIIFWARIGLIMRITASNPNEQRYRTFWLNFSTRKFIINPPLGSNESKGSRFDIERELWR